MASSGWTQPSSRSDRFAFDRARDAETRHEAWHQAAWERVPGIMASPHQRHRWPTRADFLRRTVGVRCDGLARAARRLGLAGGVLAVSVKDPWLDTTDGLVRNVLLGVFSAVAEHEVARLRERIHAGLDRARAQGKRLGRRPPSRRPRSPPPRPRSTAA